MSLEQSVTRHYTHGTLEQTILAALAAAGKDLDRLQAIDLGPIDEFHTGGRQATVEFAAQLAVQPDHHLLDIGSGIGGPARYFAAERRCRVSGVDLTEEYVAVANALSERVGLAGQVSFQRANALALPFQPASFDGAYMLHVGMNIDDKAALFREVRAVLKRGGVFGIFDIMRTSDGDLSFPLPWASSAEASFVATPETYRALLGDAGFAIESGRSRRQFAIEFFDRMRARAAEAGPSPLGLHLVMGSDFPRKTANLRDLVQRGVIAPHEMICRAV